MIARSSRSRSQTTEASSKNHISISNPSSTNSLSQLSRPKSPVATHPSPQSTNDMISTITSQKQSAASGAMEVVDNTAETDADIADNGSSSLSELDGDVSDDEQAVHPLRLPTRVADLENDSEAETEKLDRTPRKPTIILAASTLTDRSPSKLSTIITRDSLEGDTGDLDSVLDELIPSSASGDELEPQIPPSLTRLESKGSLGKRKRASPGASSFSDMPMDEPSPKRSHALGDDLQLELLNADTKAAEDLANSELEGQKTGDAASALDMPNASLEGEEPATELAEMDVPAPQRARFGRRGRRKGRKDFLVRDETLAEASDTPAQDAEEAADEEQEEDEEEQIQDEERAKRKVAADALSTIERDFRSFRERHLREQLDQADNELALLQQSNCTHPDFLARLACVDERRDEKIGYENILLKFNLRTLVTTTVAERCQLLSQYHQDVREIRDRAIEKCYMEYYALQKDRRRFGTDESAAMLYSNRKTELLAQQPSYNLEVSILSGIAKHIGFPAAPEMVPLSPALIQQDLEAMELNRQPTSATLIRTQTLQDRTQAGEQFIERTPWLNPQHPAHAHAQVNNFHTQTAPINFATPASQRRLPDATIVNGSASTVEVISNPPSSAAAPPPPPHLADIPMESPVPLSRVGRVGKEANRIQTTHSSSAHLLLAPSSASPQGDSRPTQSDMQPEFGQQVFQAPPRASPVPAPRAIRAETLAQAHQLAAIASGGPSSARFGV